MADPPKPRYDRILLKLSGEFLKGDHPFGLDMDIVKYLAGEIRKVSELGVQVGVVIGGGNIFRGAQALNIQRAAADYVGMVATMINALVLQAALEQLGIQTRVMSAIEMQAVSEPYIRRRAMRHLEHGIVVIFGCGTGNPYFTTDTAAALRANEIEAEVLMKATKVDAVYTADPKTDPGALPLEHVSYHDVLTRDLRVMDGTAVALCRENRLPILVFNLNKEGNILRAVMGEKLGTLVDEGK